MRFIVRFRYAGNVGEIDELAALEGYHAEEVGFMSDSQDVDAIKEYFGTAGRGQVDEFDSFFVVAHDGDYVAMWGMYGVVSYLTKPVYAITWGMYDAADWNWLRSKFKSMRHGLCEECGKDVMHHGRTQGEGKKKWQLVCNEKEVLV